jgi:GTP-binding protein
LGRSELLAMSTILQIICVLASVACQHAFSPSVNFAATSTFTCSSSHQPSCQRQKIVTFRYQTEDSDDNEATYYSPNVPLDDSSYRYDLDASDIDTDDEVEPSDKAADDKELAFFDEATIFARGGSGGQGSSTYQRGKGGSDGIPDGGNGGNGGDVIMVADYTLNNLAGLSLGWRPNSFGGSGASYKQAESQKSNSSARIKSFRAGTGRDAGRQFDNGRNGDDVEIRVPPGTTVQQEVEILDEFGNVTSTELIEVGQVTSDDPTLVVAKGGNGGDGSGVTRRSIVKGIKRRRAPPASGERKKLILVLKLVADIALVGVPNAGKSTFLASVTRAKPKIANVS